MFVLGHNIFQTNGAGIYFKPDFILTLASFKGRELNDILDRTSQNRHIFAWPNVEQALTVFSTPIMV